MTDKRDRETTAGGDVRQQQERPQHVDESKIGGVAHQHPNWGKEYRIDPDREPGDARGEDRSGTPKTTAPKQERS
jgi:hypothetical protein